MDLVRETLNGNRLALARLLTQIENETQLGREILSDLFPHTGHAHLVGVTGSPGTGKSTLVNAIAHKLRHPSEHTQAQKVGVVAVDPTSPFTGGAILGDRVRMRDLLGDPGIFIRSMATRGSLGGLASTTAGVVQAMDAAGYDVILIETVGVGQAEVDIARLAHTTIVIEVPGTGDDIQAIKAGILEIADILVINKADRLEVELVERALRGMIQLAHPTPHVFLHHGKIEKDVEIRKENEMPIWIPPIQKTVAIDGNGVNDLIEWIRKHQQFLLTSGEFQQREKERIKAEMDWLLQEALVRRWRNSISEIRYEEAVDQVLHRIISPWNAVGYLLDERVDDA
jgi:LAO/AO transport system kinase